MKAQGYNIRWAGMMSVLFLAVHLTACGITTNWTKLDTATESPAAETATPAPSEVPQERTLTDGMGHEVTIPAEPKRIIASYLEDYLSALDVTPVAQWSVPNGMQYYLEKKLGGIPPIAYDLPYEAVLGFKPDLLIIGDEKEVEGDKYKLFSQVAPTFVLGAQINADWRLALLKVGEVVGKTELAEQVLDDYETKAAVAKSTLHEKLPGQSAAAIWLMDGKFYIVSDKVSAGAVLYKDLSLSIPSLVQQIAAVSTVNWNVVSLEKLAQLDADHIFLINSDSGSGSEALRDPLWRSIPAVKNGRLYVFGPETSWLYTGPIANSQMIDDVMASLVE
ncbi:ABC transporter substrate-binding protein [Paenibacillus sp. PL2-23]|uniref:ABC transporter substrate-binding protein n=1 Tax=Paenibacillus sp. PL2-23 TaxID=2100729 RepID=UPI0030F801D4